MVSGWSSRKRDPMPAIDIPAIPYDYGSLSLQFKGAELFLTRAPSTEDNAERHI